MSTYGIHHGNGPEEPKCTKYRKPFKAKGCTIGALIILAVPYSKYSIMGPI